MALSLSLYICHVPHVYDSVYLYWLERTQMQIVYMYFVCMFDQLECISKTKINWILLSLVIVTELPLVRCSGIRNECYYSVSTNCKL